MMDNSFKLHNQLRGIVKEEIKSILDEKESLFNIDVKLSENIYNLLSNKLGESFTNEFPRVTDFFFFLNKNLK
jgi:hypothetical protein